MNFSIDASSAMSIAQIALSTSQDEFLSMVKDIASGSVSKLPTDSYISENIDIDTTSRYDAVENAQQGINLTQVADGSFSNVSGMLKRVKELVTQASSDIYTDEQRKAMQAEVDGLKEEIAKTLNNTTFNGKNIINVVTGDAKEADKINFQVGSNTLPSSMVAYDPNIKLDELNFDLSSAESARETMKLTDSMLNNVTAKRAEIAAVQTGLLNSVETNMTAILNNQSSSSTVGGTDYVSSMLGLVQNQITQESLVAVLSSTFKSQSSILNLLSGIPA